MIARVRVATRAGRLGYSANFVHESPRSLPDSCLFRQRQPVYAAADKSGSSSRAASPALSRDAVRAVRFRACDTPTEVPAPFERSRGERK